MAGNVLITLLLLPCNSIIVIISFWWMSIFFPQILFYKWVENIFTSQNPECTYTLYHSSDSTLCGPSNRQLEGKQWGHHHPTQHQLPCNQTQTAYVSCPISPEDSSCSHCCMRHFNDHRCAGITHHTCDGRVIYVHQEVNNKRKTKTTIVWWHKASTVVFSYGRVIFPDRPRHWQRHKGSKYLHTCFYFGRVVSIISEEYTTTYRSQRQMFFMSNCHHTGCTISLSS